MAAVAGLASLCILGAPTAPVLAAPTVPDNAAVSTLIANLSADDAAARREAGEKLIKLGLPARAAVLVAAHGDDPQVSAQAAALLLKMPWSQPDDPPDVRKILDQYVFYSDSTQAQGAAPALTPEDSRETAARALAALPDAMGWNALVRLIYEDPSNAVRWTIFHELRNLDEPAKMAQMRRPNAPADDPALAALYGLAWLEGASPKAVPLLRQAVNSEFQNPSDDGGEVDFVINLLVDQDEVARRFDDAADTLRGELKRGAPTDQKNVPIPLLRLFALHADDGPLKGFDDDQKMGAQFMQTPKLQYAMARIDLKLNQPDAAAALRQAAFEANNTSRVGRYYAGKYLADNGWDPEAEAEFRAFLAMPPGDDADDDQASDVNAHFDLGNLAIRRDDDHEAAEQKKAAMSIVGGGTHIELIKTDEHGHTWPTTEDQLWAEIHWRYLRAAQKTHDEATIATELAELIKLAPTDEDIAIDVVPLLKTENRRQDAAKFFANAHKDNQSKMDGDPQNPVWMNGQAWLDAKCDEDLAEALKLAAAASNALPDDPAIMDTLAEVNFHLGHAEESAKLETRALELQPGDKFMTAQLARFKAAAHESK